MGVALILALVAVGHSGASYDRETASLEARGAAAADLRAPSASIARVKAERQARSQAEKKLSAALAELGCQREGEALGKLLEGATVGEERFGSDGSVELKLTLSTKGLDLKR